MGDIPPMCELITGQLPVIQYPLVNKFYKDTGYGGKAGRDEQVYVTRQSTGIVAAVRLQAKSNDWFFLRAMCVAPECRGQGVGTALLKGLQSFLAEHDVYCFPFEHLQHFYAQAGFVAVDEEQDLSSTTAAKDVTGVKNAPLPMFMTEALARYRAQGRKISLMVRRCHRP